MGWEPTREVNAKTNDKSNRKKSKIKNPRDTLYDVQFTVQGPVKLTKPGVFAEVVSNGKLLLAFGLLIIVLLV